MANELVDEYKGKRKKGWVIKLNFEKAYDIVDWEFLREVFRCKGFGERWNKWIRGRITNNSFSLFVNGRPRGVIRVSWG